MVDETKLETVIKKAFQKTWQICMSDEFLKKDHTHANYFRSAKFVYEVAICLWDDLYSASGKDIQGKKLHVQEVDDQGNKVGLSETKRVYFDGVSEGNYYARGFLDLNGDSELNRGEPWDVWEDASGDPRVVRVREESRWKLEFVFDGRIGRLPSF